MEAGVGVVSWVAKERLGRWLPGEILGMIGERLGGDDGLGLPAVWCGVWLAIRLCCLGELGGIMCKISREHMRTCTLTCSRRFYSRLCASRPIAQQAAPPSS